MFIEPQKVQISPPENKTIEIEYLRSPNPPKEVKIEAEITAPFGKKLKLESTSRVAIQNYNELEVAFISRLTAIAAALTILHTLIDFSKSFFKN